MRGNRHGGKQTTTGRIPHNGRRGYRSGEWNHQLSVWQL